MAEYWEPFRSGAKEKHDVGDDVARKVFDKLMGFAEYGFPRAHAVSFAVLAYQSCWLKYHYPAEFTCALFNNQPMGFYPPHVIVNDAKRHGVRVHPPDVNVSHVRCTVEPEKIVRIGLNYVTKLGEDAAKALVAERSRNGPFRSLADLIRRVPLKREAAEALAAVGAFDRFGISRREAMWQIGLFIAPRAHANRTEASSPVGRTVRRGHRGTIVQRAMPLPVAQDMVELPAMPAWDRMAADYAGTGLSPHWHPLGLLRPHLPSGIVRSTDLERRPHNLPLTLAGMVVCRQRPGTAKGITFLLLEDEVGLVNVVVRPDLYQAERLLVRGEPFLLIAGILEKRDGTINLLAHAIRPLTEARQRLPRIEQTPEPAVPAELRALDPVLIASTPTELEAQLACLRPESHSYR